MTDMDKMMIEKVAGAIADAFYQTSRERGLYIVYDERPFWSVVLPRAARAAISAYNPDDRLTARIAELAKKAAPLLKCEQRANRSNPRVPSERIVGFVLGEDDIGMGLSEPLFALAALVELARHAMMSGGGAQSAIAHE